MGAEIIPIGRRDSKVTPYGIDCSGCGTRLMTIDRDSVMLVGALPVQMFGNPDGTLHIACQQCGTWEAVDREIIALH